MPTRLNSNQFLRPSFDPLAEISIEDFMRVAEKHEGLFVIENIEYDSVTAGKDNLYFAYCFNYHTGKAINETLFIVDKIVGLMNVAYTITAQGKQYNIILKE